MWTSSECQKYLKLLNIHSVLKEQFKNLSITGEKLFTPKYGPSYLLQHLEPIMNEQTYLPITKLITITQWIFNEHNGLWGQNELEAPYSPSNRLSMMSL